MGLAGAPQIQVQVPVLPQSRLLLHMLLLLWFVFLCVFVTEGDPSALCKVRQFFVSLSAGGLRISSSLGRGRFGVLGNKEDGFSKNRRKF